MAKKRGNRKKASVKPSAKSNAALNQEVSNVSSTVNVEAALNDLEKNISLAKSKPDENVNKGSSRISVSNIRTEPSQSAKPMWFYISSIFAAFMFTLYISIFATLHFESIEYMNITIVFLFIAMVSYFLITAIFFISEKRRWHGIVSLLFFAGLAAVMVYAFKAVDTSNLVRFSIIYTI
ncbi:MAG: hypothetical protein AABX34_06975, partial [Nanoarchaeota archaeon]